MKKLYKSMLKYFVHNRFKIIRGDQNSSHKLKKYVFENLPNQLILKKGIKINKPLYAKI